MTMRLTIVLTTAMLLLWTGTSLAEERITIPMGNRMITGGEMLKLREMLQQNGRDSCGLQLVRVRLVAKSPDSGNSAQLQVGNWKGPGQTIPGDPKGFNMPDNVGWPWESSRQISHWNQSGTSSGVWRMHVRGTVKLHAVEMFVNPGQSCP
jgi:hypothetical protein